MSFIGSALRTRGITSKLFSGGGDCTNHSSVLALQGSLPAFLPTLRLRTTLNSETSTPAARMNEPIVEIRFCVPQFVYVWYVYMRRGIPSSPSECWMRNVTLKPTNISQKESLPSDSDSILPDSFGNQ